MIVSRENDDFEPLAWARGYPLYATTLLVAAHVLTLTGAWIAIAFHQGEWLRRFVFSSADVLRSGAAWEWATYAFVHPPASPLFFIVEMFFFYLFGREVERYLGRRKYLLLYAILVLVPPMLLTALGPLFPAGLAGSRDVHFAVFITFVVLYPGVEFFLRIPVRWIAWALLAIYSLFDLARNDWSGLFAFWTDTAAAYLFVLWLRGLLPRPGFLRFFQGSAAREARPERTAPARAKTAPAADDPMAEIDPLLDKISRQGLASLSAQERERLEKARKRLLGKAKR